MKCALFVASATNKGDGNAMAITQLIQCQPKVSIDDFVYTFKDFQTCLSTSVKADQQVLSSCIQICTEF